MNKKLHILHLEDSKTDAEIIQAKLAKEGIECEITLVVTREDFTNALEQSKFDLILSDYELPSFDGLSALMIAKKQCPDVPFILVTGALGEELAIEILKKGATDYVLKGNLSRLVPSVERALKDVELITERKKAEEEIKSQLEELQRWQDVMLGREDRVQELKREVNELCHRIGGTARYLNQEDTSADSGTVEPTS